MKRWPCLKIKGYVVLVVEDVSEMELKHCASSKTSSPPPSPLGNSREESHPKGSEKRMEGRREKEEGTKESRREKKEKGSKREEAREEGKLYHYQ